MWPLLLCVAYYTEKTSNIPTPQIRTPEEQGVIEDGKWYSWVGCSVSNSFQIDFLQRAAAAALLVFFFLFFFFVMWSEWFCNREAERDRRAELRLIWEYQNTRNYAEGNKRRRICANLLLQILVVELVRDLRSPWRVTVGSSSPEPLLYSDRAVFLCSIMQQTASGSVSAQAQVSLQDQQKQSRSLPRRL